MSRVAQSNWSNGLSRMQILEVDNQRALSYPHVTEFSIRYENGAARVNLSLYGSGVEGFIQGYEDLTGEAITFALMSRSINNHETFLNLENLQLVHVGISSYA